MTSLLTQEIASPARAAAELRIRRQPGYRPVACALALLAADGLAAGGAMACGLWLMQLLRWPARAAVSPLSAARSDDILILLVVVLSTLAAKGRYSQRTPFWSECRLAILAGCCAIALEVLIATLVPDFEARALAIATFALFPVLATVANAVAKRALHHAAIWTMPVVMLGCGQNALDAEAALESDRSLGYRIVGRVDPATILVPQSGSSSWRCLSGLLDRFGGSRLLIAVDGDGPSARQLVQCALRERVDFAIMPTIRALPAFACRTSLFLSHDTRMVAFRDNLSRPLPRIIKAVMDLGIASLLLVLASPLFLVIALASLRHGGPILFTQARIGAGGRPFNCLKFRTMVVDADRVLGEALAADPALAAEWQASRKLARDPRVTPLGRFLRKTSLDELPQLINVLRRDMSLVGPRPIVQTEIDLYGEDIAQYYATRPGLTGLWQVSGRSSTSYARRVQLDVWYVNNWTIWHDCAVLLKTVPVVLRGQGAC